jgi:lysophospholipase L1-like esterase
MTTLFAAINTYPDVLYCAVAPSTIDVENTSAADFDGALTLVEGDRVLVQSGANAGVYLVHIGFFTTLTVDPHFAVWEGATIKCIRSAGSPIYQQTAETGAATPVFAPTAIRFSTLDAGSLVGGAGTALDVANASVSSATYLDLLDITFPSNTRTAAEFAVVLDGAPQYFSNAGTPPTSQRITLTQGTHTIAINRGNSLIDGVLSAVVRSGPASVQTDGNIAFSPAARRLVDFIVVGDSICNGANTTHPTTDAWPALVRAAQPTWNVALIGGGGWSLYADASTETLCNALVARIVLAQSGAPNTIIWIALGYNDMAQGHWTSDAYQRSMQRLVAKLHNQLPLAQIYVQAPLTATVDTGLPAFRTAASNACTGIANVTYVNGATLVTELGVDGIHPNTAGHALLSPQIQAIATEFNLGKLSSTLAAVQLIPGYYTIDGSTRVNSLIDLSGNGHNFASPTETQRPAFLATDGPNSTASMQGNRTNVVHTLMTTMPAWVTKFTKIVIVKWAAAVGGEYHFAMDDTTPGACALDQDGAGAIEVRTSGGATQLSGTTPSGWHIYEIYDDGSGSATSYVRVDGGTPIPFTSPSSNVSAGLCLFAHGSGTAHVANGLSLFGAALCTGQLSPQDRSILKGYLLTLGLSTAY